MNRDARTHGRMDASRRRAHASVRLCVYASLLFLAPGCRREAAEAQAEAQNRQNDVPVAINGESPFQYPAELYDQGIEGEVRLRLWVDSTGRIATESTRVTSSSGTAALDSAAVAGSALLQFAPAHRDGRPVAAAFYQPVIFRRRAAAAGAPN
jgi:TonB family protein